MNPIIEAMPMVLVSLVAPVLLLLLIVGLSAAILIGYIRDWRWERSIRKTVRDVTGGIDTTKPVEWIVLDVDKPVKPSPSDVATYLLAQYSTEEALEIADEFCDRLETRCREIEDTIWKEPEPDDPIPHGIPYFLEMPLKPPFVVLEQRPFTESDDYEPGSDGEPYFIDEARQQAHIDSIFDCAGVVQETPDGLERGRDQELDAESDV